MTSSEANDVATPEWDPTGKSVHEVLQHLWDKVYGTEATAPASDYSAAIADLEKRVSNLETEVGMPSPEDIPAADSGATPPSA